MIDIYSLQSKPTHKFLSLFDVHQLRIDYNWLLLNQGFDSASNVNKPLYDKFSHLEKFYSDKEKSFYEHISLTSFEDQNSNGKFYFRNEHNMSALLPQIPTYTRSVLEKFSPYFHRSRYSTILPGGLVKPHRDYNLGYSIRLHIPIITNDDSFIGFQLGNDSSSEMHLPADGHLWFFNQSLLHWARNDGDKPRTHLIISVRPEILKDTNL